MEEDVMFTEAINHHTMQVHRYADLFAHELRRSAPNKTMLTHYMESIQAHMRMGADAALFRRDRP